MCGMSNLARRKVRIQRSSREGHALAYREITREAFDTARLGHIAKDAQELVAPTLRRDFYCQPPDARQVCRAAQEHMSKVLRESLTCTKAHRLVEGKEVAQQGRLGGTVIGQQQGRESGRSRGVGR